MTGIRHGQAVEGDIFTFFCSVSFSGDFSPRQVWSDADGRPLDGSREETTPANGPTTGVSRSNVRLSANRTMHGRRFTCTTHMEYRSEATATRVRFSLFRVTPLSPVPPSTQTQHYISKSSTTVNTDITLHLYVPIVIPTARYDCETWKYRIQIHSNGVASASY